MVNRYSWNLRCERKLWHRKVTLHHCWNLLLKGQNSGTLRKKTNIEKILNIENKLHLQISLLLGAMPSVVCTVKIEFSSELISQIRGVILYLADSEHDPASAPSPRLQRWVHLSSVAETVVSFSPCHHHPPVLLSSCSLLLDHLCLSRGRVSVPSPSHPTSLLFFLSSPRLNVSQKLVMSFSHFVGLFWI